MQKQYKSNKQSYKSKDDDRSKTKQQKEQRIVHKGIYISNQRRKGPGGRIKCDTISCKIQVNDINAAIHESEVEFVQIRRYVKGDKKDNKYGKKNVEKKDNKNEKDKNNKDKPGKKFVQVKKEGNNNETKKNQQNKDKINQNQFPSLQQKQQNSSPQKSPSEQSSPTYVTTQISLEATVKQEMSISRKHITEEKNEIHDQKGHQVERNQDQVETESEHEDDEERQQHEGIQMVEKREQVIMMKKTQQQVKDKTLPVDEKQGEKSKQQTPAKREEIIVARIVKETKIVYKQKKFVAILTCEKKKNVKGSFVEKDIKPIQKICHDYYLDVAPIHSRLPKMEMDNLVPDNLKVLTEYIEKSFPEKGKQLTKKKLNDILDVIESIYVVASFGLWENGRPYANIHQVIGKTMTIDGECNCFLFEHHLNDFNYDDIEIQKEKQKKIELKPTQHHKKYDKMVFTIDPATSVDLDDALSIEKINEDLFEVGIHISDVSEYLKYIEREELIKRTTSVYLPHKCFHMLTPELMKIASLNPNVERLAFSIYVKMNFKGEIVEPSRVEKNVIKSRFKLSYQTVQDIITAKINFDQFLKKHPQTTSEQFEILVQKIQYLTKIGLAHREKRIKFEVFENKQIHFQLDEDRWPVEISVQSRFTSKKIVQEYMIIGNVEAATHLIKNFKQKALIIYHPQPSQLAIKNFNETFKFLGKTFTFEDIQQVQNQFLQIESDKTISEEIKQYMYFKGRRMQQSAGYMLYQDAVKDLLSKQGENNPDAKLKNVHFALGQDFYTHFTSPMRRMADILVHETLNSIIYKTEPKSISPEQIQKINDGRKHTKRLKKDLTEMYICLMIHKTGKKIIEDGIVTSFGLKSVSIYIPFFDMMKEIIWRDELELDRVSKNRQNEEILDVCIYYDKRSPSRDIMWKVKKYDKVKLIIECTKRPPLRLAISLQVTSTKGKKQLIRYLEPQV